MSNYAERLYGQFQKEKVTFHRWIVAALLLTVFYIFVFLPYLALLTNIAELANKQSLTDTQINQTEAEIKMATTAVDRASRLMGDASEYQRLYEDANSWIDDMDKIKQAYDSQSRLVARLRDSLTPAFKKHWPEGKVPDSGTVSLLKELNPDLMKNFQPGNDCFFKLEADWIACQVNRKRRPINEKLYRVLYDRGESHEYTSVLKQEIEANDEQFGNNLSKALASASLKQWIRDYLGEEQAIIRRWYEYMAAARSSLVKQSRLLQKVRTEHSDAEALLAQRKTDLSQAGEIKSPIGTIKLGFHDLLSLVPFLGLLILSVLLGSTHRQLVLRSAFRANGPEEESTDIALMLTMPVWLEPLRSRWINLLLLVLPVLLGCVAITGLWQLMTNPGLAVAEVELNAVLITVFTVFVSAVFAALYLRLVAHYLSLSNL